MGVIYYTAVPLVHNHRSWTEERHQNWWIVNIVEMDEITGWRVGGGPGYRVDLWWYCNIDLHVRTGNSISVMPCDCHDVSNLWQIDSLFNTSIQANIEDKIKGSPAIDGFSSQNVSYNKNVQGMTSIYSKRQNIKILPHSQTHYESSDIKPFVDTHLWLFILTTFSLNRWN